MAIPKDYSPLPGSERAPAKGATLVGSVKATERLTVALLLRERPGSPELPDLEHWQNTPPHQRRFLSEAEFSERHGSSDNDLKAVLDYLASKGLRVLEAHAGD